jgi:uncharacterized protein with FMN-binding domain
VKKIHNGIVALSSAAIIAVYAAGHARTRSAAEELDAASNQRRPGIPGPAAADAAAVAAPPEPADRRSGPAPASMAPAAQLVPAAQPPAATGSPETVSVKAAQPKTAAAPATSSVTVSSLPAAAVSGPAVSTVATPAAVTPAPASPAGTASTATAEGAAPAAPSSELEAAKPAAVKKAWKDGTYRSWGRSRHGDMLAFVVIENGRIVHAGVDKCQTRWPCSIVAHLYPQVLQRQSAEVDYVSGATQSANAFYYGIVDALAMAEGAAVEPRPIPQ